MKGAVAILYPTRRVGSWEGMSRARHQIDHIEGSREGGCSIGTSSWVWMMKRTVMIWRLHGDLRTARLGAVYDTNVLGEWETEGSDWGVGAKCGKPRRRSKAMQSPPPSSDDDEGAKTRRQRNRINVIQNPS